MFGRARLPVGVTPWALCSGAVADAVWESGWGTDDEVEVLWCPKRIYGRQWK